MHSLVIFASGKGSNAAAIIDYFHQGTLARVSLIVSNNAQAGVLDIARAHNIPFLIIDRETVKEQLLTEQLKEYTPSLIILAGFLWKIPDSLLHAFPGKMVNIHPSLLPRYGGKGMYGQRVHEAVIAAGEQESGITIHFVNEHYDEGMQIVQARCAIAPGDSAQVLAQRIRNLEHAFFPKTIEYLLQNNIRQNLTF